MSIGAITSRYSTKAANGITKVVGPGITKLAKGCESSKFFQKLAEPKNLAMAKKWMPGIFGLWISGFYVLNNLKSKKIPQERKTPLLINDVITTTFGFVGGLVLSEKIFKFKDAMLKNFEKANSALKPAELNILKAGLATLIPLVAFTFMFRYIGPVIATPLADKVNKFLINKGIIEDPEKAKKLKEQNNQIAMKGNVQAPAAQQVAGSKMDYSMLSGNAQIKGSPDFQDFLNKVGFQANKNFIA
jgi:hypothetical protein